MEILDQDIERDDNELHNTQVVHIQGVSISSRILGIIFLLLGTGGVLLAASFFLRYNRYIDRGWADDISLELEPITLFGLGGLLAVVTGFFFIKSGIKSARDIRQLRNLSDNTLVLWNKSLMMMSLTISFIVLFILYLIVQYGID
ncbi:hypothetical protein N9Y29_00520 [Crocinitomicaceae bacterium]|nr:hypothetical protein [Crocinitomicaceae bacterium]